MPIDTTSDLEVGDRVRVISYGEAPSSFPIIAGDEFVQTEGVVTGFRFPYIIVSGIQVQAKDYQYNISHFKRKELEKINA